MNRRLLPLALLLTLASPVLAQDKGYDVKSYSATIHLDRSRDSIWGVVRMNVRSTSFLQQVVQHAKYLTIDTVRVGVAGNVLGVHWVDTASGTYMVDCSMPAGRDFTLVTQYHGKPRPEQTGGNWGGVTNSDTMMFAMGVGLNAPYTSTTRHWLPCYDLPDDKADSVEFYFWSDSNEVVASNGVEDIMFANHQRVTHWIERWPIATYLMTFAVGPYTTTNYFSTTGAGGQMFALQRDSIAANKVYTDLVAPSLAFFDSLFVPYPFEKVGYVVTPIGSMEHQTMICLDKHVLGNTWSNTTPSHELAHMWWGDWVTCKTFDDAWLNEGFATYCESLVHERFEGRAAYIAKLASDRASEVNVTRGKMKIDTLPIYAASTANHHQNNYPLTIYKKGAVVLGMLRSYLGDALFFQALRTYGRNHAYGNVTTEDLQRTIESMSGQNLSWFFREFIYDRGAPVVDVTYRTVGNHLTLDLTQVQDSLGFRFFRMPLFVKTAKASSEYQAIWLDSIKTTHIELDIRSPSDTVVIDPDRTALIATRFVSTTADVKAGDRERFALNVVPNPASSTVMIEVSSDRDRAWSRIDLFDVRGALRMVQNVDTTASWFTQSVDVHSLPSGVYSVVLSTSDGQQFVRQVVVQ